MKNLVSLSDRELIESYVKNNHNPALETLIYRHKEKVYSCIYNLVKDKTKADDIFQNVFIKVIDKLKKGEYAHEDKFAHWVVRISYNMCMDKFREKTYTCSFPEAPEGDSFSLAYIPDSVTEMAIEKEQKINVIRKMIDLLPVDQRDVVILRHYSELSFKEIAVLMGCSVNTALGRMRYGLMNLKRMIVENDLATAL